MVNLFFLIPLILIGLEPTHVELTNDNNVYMVQVITITDTDFIMMDTYGDTLKIPLGLVKKISTISNDDTLSSHEYSSPAPLNQMPNLSKVTQVVEPQQRKHLIGVSMGIGLPKKPADFSDYWKNGFQLGIQFGGKTGRSKLGVEIDYARFKFDRGKFREDLGLQTVSVSGGETSLLTIIPVLRVGSTNSFGKSQFFSMYLGAGFFSLNINDLKLSLYDETVSFETNSDSGVAFKSGIGVDFPTKSLIGFSVEISYLLAATEEKNTSVLSIKGLFSIYQ